MGMTVYNGMPMLEMTGAAPPNGVAMSTTDSMETFHGLPGTTMLSMVGGVLASVPGPFLNVPKPTSIKKGVPGPAATGSATIGSTALGIPTSGTGVGTG